MFAQLHKLYSQLAPSSSSPMRFQNYSLREKDKDGCLQRPFFKIALSLAHQGGHGNHPMSIMVTASHNPPCYNGVKIDHLLPGLSLNQEGINEILRSQETVLDLLGDQKGWKKGSGIFYLGRDKRPTSLKLSSVIGDVLVFLGYTVIDLGERTTPELVSLSQFLHQIHMKGVQFSLALVDSYFRAIKDIFIGAIHLVSLNSGKDLRRKKICLDFANGVGGQSFKRYSFLEEYFDIIQTNYSEFHQPNVKCGAEWIYKHYKQNGSLPSLDKYPYADEYFFFDGDSDRIVAVQQGDSELLNGDDFNAHFIHILRIIFDRLYPNQSIGCVGNLTSNNGLTKYTKDLNATFQIAAVGVNHLFKSVKRYEVGCYFEPSGHGGFYFSDKIRDVLQQMAEERWQAQLLLALDSMSQNNPRGYALHNMLIFQIISHFMNLKQWRILQKSYQISKQFHLTNPEKFENASVGGKLLEKPQELRQIIEKMCLKYPTETILLRKSASEPILKLFIQGEKEVCHYICQQLQEQISNFLNKS